MLSKNKTPTKGRLGKKLIISMGSFLFFLVILELSIRLFVFAFFGFMRFQRAPSHSGLDGKRILCVGDSYTFGGELNSEGKTYPDILQMKFAAAQFDKFSVINQGVCETTTGELYSFLPALLDKFKPEVVVLLVGSSNRFRSWENVSASHSRSLRWFADLRVAKMVRIIWLNLKAKDAAGSFDGVLSKFSFLIPMEPNKNVGVGDMYHFYRTMHKMINSRGVPQDPSKKLWHYGEMQEFKEGIAYGRSLLKDKTNGNIDVSLALVDLYYSSGAHENADALLTTVRGKHPGSKKLKMASAYYYEKIADNFRSKSKNEKAIKYYLKAIEIDPNRGYSYYLMNKVFSLQSYYDSDRIYRELKRISLSNPVYAESLMFTKNLKYYNEKQRWEAGIEQRAYNDLDRIAVLCKRNKVKLIAMNYPMNYPMANRLLERVASKHKLPFVDNFAAFKDLKPREKYFFDDDHCTVAGHQIIADNVYRKLIGKATSANSSSRGGIPSSPEIVTESKNHGRGKDK